MTGGKLDAEAMASLASTRELLVVEGEALDRRLRHQCEILKHCLSILMHEIVFERLPTGRIAARRVQELLAEAGIKIPGLGNAPAKGP